MFRNATFAAVFTTIYLVVYIVMINMPTLLPYGELMLLLSPAIILWMVYTILKYGRQNNTTLDGEEFGYQDKDKSELGVF